MSRLLISLVSALCLTPMLGRAESGSAFSPGEQASYKVAYLGITAGSADISVGAQMEKWGKSVWPIVAMARTQSVVALYPVKDKFVTYWDSAAQTTLGSDLFADEGRKKRLQRIRIHDTGKATVVKQKEGAAQVEEQHEIDARSLDMAAVAFALRNKPLKVGDTYEMPVFTGAKSFTLRASVEGKQMLPTRMGDREVVRVRIATAFSGKLAAKRDMFAYLTTDARHVPVKVEAEFLLGHIVAELTQYQEGKQLAAVETASAN